MLIPIERLIDGIVHTLTERVLPDVSSRFARAQLYAAIDVLRNMRDRVEQRTDVLAAEAASAAEALERTTAHLRDGGESALAARIAAALAEVPGEPAAARLDGLRAVLVSALETIETLPEAAREAAARPLVAHLTGQALRDVALTKPSLLGEISKG